MAAFRTPVRSPQQRGARIVGCGIAGIALTLSVVGVSAGPASAIEDDGDTVANAEVLGGITLTGLTPAFTLTGTPGATVGTGADPVTYNVETNNETGYTVTVHSTTANMLPADVDANDNVIPIATLTVRETGPGSYTAMTEDSVNPVEVHTQDARSDDGGDNLSTDFQMRIPTVNADTYTATLNYVAATAL